MHVDAGVGTGVENARRGRGHILRFLYSSVNRIRVRRTAVLGPTIALVSSHAGAEDPIDPTRARMRFHAVHGRTPGVLIKIQALHDRWPLRVDGAALVCTMRPACLIAQRTTLIGT
jgi:hypothetical protein